MAVHYWSRGYCDSPPMATPLIALARQQIVSAPPRLPFILPSVLDSAKEVQEK
jgi:hypothetical protein